MIAHVPKCQSGSRKRRIAVEAATLGASVLVRGVQEMQLTLNMKRSASHNRVQNGDVEMSIITQREEYRFVSSSMMEELWLDLEGRNTVLFRM